MTLLDSVSWPLARWVADAIACVCYIETQSVYNTQAKSSHQLLVAHPPFWFNIAKCNEITGVHDHAQLASFSGVVYLRCNSSSGHLYFPQSGGEEFSITPEVGKMVLFPSHARHGVHPNKSDNERISLAFNLYPFPLPSEEWQAFRYYIIFFKIKVISFSIYIVIFCCDHIY